MLETVVIITENNWLSQPN